MDTGVDELPQRLLGPLDHLLDANFVWPVTDMTPLTAPHFMAVDVDGSAEGVVPVGVRLALDRHRENEALFSSLDLGCRPVRASIHCHADGTLTTRCRASRARAARPASAFSCSWLPARAR